ncbi:MAG: hypothetical protein KAR13_20305 [Desulfobulbaceae bacterium]|nr:hypothetical protein [Desulfobulbaceae bacterium]
MPPFICDYLNEIVLLSDGSCTTCCLDPLGLNIFSNIYDESLTEIRDKYFNLRNRITRDVLSMPKCAICYSKIKAAGFPQTGTYKTNPSDEEIDAFLEKGNNTLNRYVIELSSLCNLKCNGCMQSRVNFNDYRKKPFLDVDFLSKWLVDDIKSIGHIRLYNYGETFLNKQAIDFCSFIKKKRQETIIEIATNGLLLNSRKKRLQLVQSGVDCLIFSIHGGSQESVQKYMTEKFDFEAILNILKDLVKIKQELNAQKPKLIWKYLLFEWNDSDEEIDKARNLSDNLGLGPLLFDFVGFPSPSKRFTRESKEWQQLVRSSQQ